MEYCSYEFYKNEYLGNVIAETDFPRLIKRAYSKLNTITFGRVEQLYKVGPEDELINKVKESLCRTAELLSDIEIAEKEYRENGGKELSSVSSGSESKSFTKNNLVGAVLTDKKAQNQLFYDTAKEYLSGTGLLYAGI